MAVIFKDGFDWYTTADLTKKWTATSAGNLIVQTTTRSPSGQGLTSSGNNSSLSGTAVYKSFGTNYTQGVVGVAYQAITMANRTVLVIGDGTSEQISIRVNASSVTTVTRSGTVVATGTTVLSSNTWYYIELKFTIHPSAGVVEVKVNGASEIASTTSLNTRSTGVTQWNAVGLGTSASFDDLYVLDPTAGTNTTFLGPIRCVAISPAAPGNYAQWTPNGGTNYGNVSEPFEDGDTSFNQSSTANQIDSFVMQDLPVSSGSVFAVEHILVSRQDAGAARTIAPLTRISSTDYVGTTQSLSSSYQFIGQIYDTSPATSSAWTTSEVAGMEAGYKLIS